MAEYQQYLDFAIDLAKKVSRGLTRRWVRELTSTSSVKAGEMIKEGQAKRFSDDSSLDTKQNAIDVSLSFVTKISIMLTLIAYSSLRKSIKLLKLSSARPLAKPTRPTSCACQLYLDMDTEG